MKVTYFIILLVTLIASTYASGLKYFGKGDKCNKRYKDGSFDRYTSLSSEIIELTHNEVGQFYLIDRNIRICCNLKQDIPVIEKTTKIVSYYRFHNNGFNCIHVNTCFLELPHGGGVYFKSREVTFRCQKSY